MFHCSTFPWYNSTLWDCYFFNLAAKNIENNAKHKHSKEREKWCYIEKYENQYNSKVKSGEKKGFILFQRNTLLINGHPLEKG